jgi:hypothetical protein
MYTVIFNGFSSFDKNGLRQNWFFSKTTSFLSLSKKLVSAKLVSAKCCLSKTGHSLSKRPVLLLKLNGPVILLKLCPVILLKLFTMSGNFALTIYAWHTCTPCPLTAFRAPRYGAQTQSHSARYSEQLGLLQMTMTTKRIPASTKT